MTFGKNMNTGILLSGLLRFSQSKIFLVSCILASMSSVPALAVVEAPENQPYGSSMSEPSTPPCGAEVGYYGQPNGMGAPFLRIDTPQYGVNLAASTPYITGVGSHLMHCVEAKVTDAAGRSSRWFRVSAGAIRAYQYFRLPIHINLGPGTYSMRIRGISSGYHGTSVFIRGLKVPGAR